MIKQDFEIDISMRKIHQLNSESYVKWMISIHLKMIIIELKLHRKIYTHIMRIK